MVICFVLSAGLLNIKRRIIIRLLIDADIIARRAACAADSKSGGDQGLERACYNARSMMLTVFMDNETTDHVGYLGTRGDRTQHRYKIYPEYKANRKNIEYPKYLDQVREYLIQEFNIEVVEGIEADDALSIEQHKNMMVVTDEPQDRIAGSRTIICTIDKDLLIVPGWHYHLTKKTKHFQSELEGLKCFYKQIIEGDQADGIPRVAPKVHVTGKLCIKEHKRDWLVDIDNATDEKEMLDIVRQCYYNILYKDNLYNQEDIDKEILWRGQLLMPLNKRGELWHLPQD